jgi:hypothetical protein
MNYKVVVVSGECCSPLSDTKIQKVCNDMAAGGYVLVAAFPESVQTCGGGKRATFLIFAHP